MDISIMGSYAYVCTPYNSDFTARIKKIPGTNWRAKLQVWYVPRNEVDHVRAIMQDVFGYTDLTDQDRVTVKMFFHKEFSVLRSDVILFGKVLSHAWGANTKALYEDNVTYLSGRPKAGGSGSRWYSAVEKGSVVLLSKVSASKLSESKLMDGVTWEVISSSSSSSAAIKERSRIVNKIEIPTWKTTIGNTTPIVVEAGTNNLHGDAGRTYVCIQSNNPSVEYKRINNEDGRQIGIEMRLGGDDELTNVIAALKFG